MSFRDGIKRLTGAHIPDSERAVLSGCRQHLSVGRVDQTIHPTGQPRQYLPETPVSGIPQTNGPVRTGGGNGASVGRQGYGLDDTGRSTQSCLRVTLRKVIQHHGFIRAGGSKQSAVGGEGNRLHPLGMTVIRPQHPAGIPIPARYGLIIARGSNSTLSRAGHGPDLARCSGQGTQLPAARPVP